MLEEAYDLLKEQDIRVTPQRKAILEMLYNRRGQHLEIEDIHRCLALSRKNVNKPGLATVYRTIELFQKVGLVHRLPMERSPARYEFIGPGVPGHHHLICLECGKVEEIGERLVVDFKRRIMGDRGFAISGRPIKIYGYCSKCKREHKKA